MLRCVESFIRPIAQFVGCATGTMAWLTEPPIPGLVPGKFMAVKAHGFSRINCRGAIAKQNIFRYRHNPEMGRVNAQFYPTDMIQGQPGRNNSAVNLERKSVCQNLFSVVAKTAIAFPDFCCRPNPATPASVLINLGPES